MTDYKSLRDKFTEKLKEFDKERLVKWIEFDQNREILGQLLCGEKVKLEFNTITASKLDDDREKLDSAEDYSYAMAA